MSAMFASTSARPAPGAADSSHPKPEPTDAASVTARPLSFFTGKGGVGKSTLVAAIALAAARQGRRPLVVELGHRASMQSIFGVEHIGFDPVQVAPGVHALNLEPERAYEAYLRKHVPIPLVARRIGRSSSLRRFFWAAPAVLEVLTLECLGDLLEQDYQPVLVDFDATGHALMFLELPRVFEGLAAQGPIRRLLDRFVQLLSDRENTALHLVALPTRVVVQETLDLHARLREEHPTLPLGTLFINRVPPGLDGVGDPALVARAKTLAQDAGARSLLEDLALLELAEQRSRRARQEILRLTALPMPAVVLPESAQRPMDADGLAQLGAWAVETGR